MAFNAHQNTATKGQTSYNSETMNQDIGFMTVASNYSSSQVVWLTSTAGVDEADSSIARWQPAGDSAEQYLVGWAEPSSAAYKLARVSPQGAILEGPVDIGASAKWGQRDDPMRRHQDGDIVWSWFETSGATELKFARLDSEQAACVAP